jgi:GntR family transcriptional repressor for pyruvate dehydrogenase complex
LNKHRPSGFLKYRRVERTAIPEQIAGRLIALIRENQLRPGDRLPPERALASMMGVSRSTLREALRALSILNIIEMRQGDGTYVSSLDIELLVEPLDYILTMDSPTLTQLFEVRRILELGAINLASERIQPEEIERLDNCLKRYVNGCQKGDYEMLLHADMDLHETIVQATRNPILLRFVTSLRLLGKASREHTVKLSGVPDQTIRDHEAIIEGLKKRDASASQRAMLKHLNHIETSLKEFIFTQQEGSERPPPNSIE